MARIVVLVIVVVLGAGPGCGSEGCTGGACAATRGLLSETTYLQSHQVGGGSTGAFASPSARYLASLAYDAAANDFVLFGGQTSKGTSDETWTFAPPTTWRLATPAHRPAPRRGAAMAWDPASRAVLMYGGHVADKAEGVVSDETWAWDGHDWTQLSTAPDGPGRREDASMVTAGQRVLLFGGHEFNAVYYANVWTRDGGRWTRVDRDPTPEARGNAGVVWDASDSSLLVFGGNGLRADAGPGNLGLPLSDAWRLQDGAWSVIDGPPDTVVMPRAFVDPTNLRVTVEGVRCPSSAASRWELNTGHWSQLQGGGFGLWGVAVASAPNGTTLMFGGSTEKAC